MTKSYSNSELQSYKNCPLQWRFQWDLALRQIDLESSEHHLRFGAAFHAGLEQLYRGNGLTAARDAFVVAYPTQLDPNDRAKTQANGVATLVDYANRWRDEDRRYRVIAIESRSDDPWSVKPDLVVENIEQGGVYLIDHKAQPLTSNLLTPRGWIPMGSAIIGTELFGMDGNIYEVLGVYPQGKIRSYEVTFGDRSKVKCSGDHLWTVTSQYYDRSVTLTLDKIAHRMNTKIGAGLSKHRFRVPLPEPIPFPAQELPVDPYLLGVLLGDGCLCVNTPQVSIGKQDEDQMVVFIQNVLPDGIEAVKCRSANFSWNLSDRKPLANKNRLMTALNYLGLKGRRSHDKFVPDIYLRGDVLQRTKLLQGLLDTDGCCSDGRVLFDSTSLQLAKDVTYLVRSLGGHATLRKRAGTKQQAYRVSIRFDNEIQPFRLTRKQSKVRNVRRKHGKYIRKIEFVGIEEMQCIKTSAPDGLYITDDFTVTHNTTGQYLNYQYWEQFQPNSQITHYLDYAQSKYGPIEGFIINAIGFRYRERAYKGEPAGFWNHFERQTFNRRPAQLDYERVSRQLWIEDLERSVELGFYRTNTGSCRFCSFKPICAPGWTWEEDRELIELSYRQVCNRLIEGGGVSDYCVLDRGHEGGCSIQQPSSDVEVFVEVEG